MRHSHNNPKKVSRNQGYTLVETMMSLGVLLTSTLGIMALEHATINGNRSAQRISLASQLADTAIDGLELESAAWYMSMTQTQAETEIPNLVVTLKEIVGGLDPVSGMAEPSLGQGTPIPLDVADNKWRRPIESKNTALAMRHSAGGETVVEADSVANRTYVCTFIRIYPIYFQLPGPIAFRADVMVWWAHEKMGDAADYLNCGGHTTADDIDNFVKSDAFQRDTVHVMSSTVLRPRPPQESNSN